MTQITNRLFAPLKVAAALFCTAPAVFADSSQTVPVEICRGDSAHVEIKLPAGTTLVHGSPGNAASYTVTVRESATIQSYADCLHVEADASSNDAKVDDELHLPADGNQALNIKGTVIRRAASASRQQKSEERAKRSNRTNWPN